MKRVLIVEDDPTWSMLIGRYVDQLSWEFEVVRSPQEALDVLDDAEVDVIVLDLLLAVETGMALLNEIQAYDDLSDIPILVLTNTPDVALSDVSSYGVKCLLDKASVTPDDIKFSLKELADGRK